MISDRDFFDRIRVNISQTKYDWANQLQRHTKLDRTTALWLIDI